MKKALLYLMTIAAFMACDNTDEPGKRPDPKPGPEDMAINIQVDQERLTAYQVVYSIYPDDKDAYYYSDVMSKARWESADIKSIKAEFDESLRNFANMTGATYEEVLEQMLFKGDTVDFLSNAGYRGETDFVIFAFYWDGDETEFSYTEFTTPAHVDSNESVTLTFEAVDAYSMSVKCEPTEGVTEYYYHFAETTMVDTMLGQLEDENAYLSYQAMNVGVKYTGTQTVEQKGLKPETEYTAIVMLIDENGNRAQVSAKYATPAVEHKERVESELFESLLGEWSGIQTVCDGYSEPVESQFTVTISQSVDDYDYDYRANNQLVALVDGWNNIAYYGIQGLVDEGVENPEEKFGPKWVLDIAEGDVVTIDGQARHSVIGWMFYGDCFMVSANNSSQSIDVTTTLNVEVSEDGNTLTITSPMAECYPSLAYNFTGFGWMANFYGMSDIVLTRK